MKLVLIKTINGDFYAIQKGLIFKKYMRIYNRIDKVSCANDYPRWIGKKDQCFILCMVPCKDIDIIRSYFPKLFKDQFEIIEDQKSVRERMQ